ncbi:MAG: hypothetical protein Kow0079_06170 [Vicingaceae bacterium]
MRGIFVIVLISFSLCVSAQTAQYELLVKFNSPEAINHNSLKKALSLSKHRSYSQVFARNEKNFSELSKWYSFKFSDSASFNQSKLLFKKIKQIKSIQEAPVVKFCYTPNDPLVSNQYYLNLIDAYNAWNIQQGDTNVVIGIVDTGWDPGHVDLQGNVKINYADPVNNIDDDADGYVDNYIGWDLGENDNDATFQSNSHGVNVSGLAAAVTDNSNGIASVGFKCKFLPVKVSNAAGQLTQAYQGIVYAADHGCKIINCSWGSYSAGQFEKDIINYAVNVKGCLVIAAVGNDNQEALFYPAAFNDVLSVVATDTADVKWSGSNYHKSYDIAAPGLSTLTTSPASNYFTNTGTSMAAPIVSTAAALVAAQYPSYSNRQIAALLKGTTDNIDLKNPTYKGKLGTGRLNVFNTLGILPKWFEIDSVFINDGNDEIFVQNDTLTIIPKATNFFVAQTNLTAYVTTGSSAVTIIDNQSVFGSLNPNTTVKNTPDPFKIVVNNNVFDEQIELTFYLTDGIDTTYFYEWITINSSYLNLEENLLGVTITGKSLLGYNDNIQNQGIGITYKGEQMMYEGGFMLSVDFNTVKDNLRNNSGGFDNDFMMVLPPKNHFPFITDRDLDAVFSDGSSFNPLPIEVTQFSYAYKNAPNDHFVILTYKIKNTGFDTLNNLKTGLFFDWDIDNAYQNFASADSSLKLGYCLNVDSSKFIGVKILSTDSFYCYAADNIPGGNGGVDINDGWSETEKYFMMHNNRYAAGLTIGNDVVQVVSGEQFNLMPNQEKHISFAIVAGDSLQQLLVNATQAQWVFDNDNLLSTQELNVVKDITLYPNPTGKMLYISAEQNIKAVKIIGINGMIYDDINVHNKSTINIDFSNLKQGLYILQIIMQDGSNVHKKVLKVN